MAEKIDERLKELEKRFYEECCYGRKDCRCGITECGPPVEVLLELILGHLGLEVEKVDPKWTLKKKK